MDSLSSGVAGRVVIISSPDSSPARGQADMFFEPARAVDPGSGIVQVVAGRVPANPLRLAGGGEVGVHGLLVEVSIEPCELEIEGDRRCIGNVANPIELRVDV